MIRIGISGWIYPAWRGVFYPKGLIQREELSYASRQVSSIEINGTHYSLQKPESFRRWSKETPDDFVFSVKGSRYITHLKRLKSVEQPLANFFASGVLTLGRKLGPFLWQLPPSLTFDSRLESFLEMLPHTTADAARMARRKDAWMKGRSSIPRGNSNRLRHCLEVRHSSFMVPEFFALLRKYRVGFVFADTAGKWPYAEDLTADFVYIRLHGDKQIYVSGYHRSALRHWKARIERWASGGAPADARLVSSPAREQRQRDVFVYFDNDVKVRAPADAVTLREMLGV